MSHLVIRSRGLLATNTGPLASDRAREGLASLLAWGLPFLVYLRTLAPTIYGLDSAELTVGAYTLGIVHPPGSPTYLLLGHVFAWLPIGDVGYRLNLFSAVAASLSVLFVYRILRLLTDQRTIALGTAWFFGLSYYVWTSAVAAELYALSACFFAAQLWLVIRWRKDHQPWQLYVFAAVYGVGLGTHLSLALFAPGFAWLLFTAHSPLWRQPRVWVLAALCGALGAMVYLYIPLRYAANPPFNYAQGDWQVDLTTLEGFWWMITGRMFDSLFFAVPAAFWTAELGAFLGRLVSNFLGLGIVIGLVGLVGEIKRRSTLQVGLLLMVATYLAFYVPYGAGDKDTMFLPVFVLWGLEIGFGFDVLCEWAHRYYGQRHDVGVLALVLLMTASALVLNFRFADLSSDWRARQRGESILAIVPSYSYYFGTWADVPILEYLQVVERRGAGVTAVNLFFFGPQKAIQLAEQNLALGLPVYASVRIFPEDRFELTLIEACQCYDVVLRPAAPGREP